MKIIYHFNRKEVFFMGEFPINEIATAVMALVSYILGLLTKKKVK
jgi:hypothetical protein